MANQLTLTDQIRRAVIDCGISRNRICKATGIDKSAMSRFVSGKGGLSVESVDALGAFLRIEIVVRGHKPTR